MLLLNLLDFPMFVAIDSFSSELILKTKLLKYSACSPYRVSHIPASRIVDIFTRGYQQLQAKWKKLFFGELSLAGETLDNDSRTSWHWTRKPVEPAFEKQSRMWCVRNSYGLYTRQLN